MQHKDNNIQLPGFPGTGLFVGNNPDYPPEKMLFDYLYNSHKKDKLNNKDSHHKRMGRLMLVHAIGGDDIIKNAIAIAEKENERNSNDFLAFSRVNENQQAIRNILSREAVILTGIIQELRKVEQQFVKAVFDLNGMKLPK